MKDPIFSVIIPTLNEEHFIGKLLSSLLQQTVKPYEIIIVDGSSEDTTRGVVKSFMGKMKNIRLLTVPKANLSVQRNHGAKAAIGEWFVFIDADSIVLPYFMERIIHYVHTKTTTFFTTWFSPDGDTSSDGTLALFMNLFIEGSVMVRRPLAPGPLTVVRKDIFEKINGYDEERTFGEDFDLTRRIVETGEHLDIFREPICIWSSRRIKKEGKFHAFQLYLKIALLTVLSNRTPRALSGYIMGGQYYGQTKPKKKVNQSRINNLKLRIKKMVTKFHAVKE